MILLNKLIHFKHPVLLLFLLVLLVTQSAFQQTDLVIVQDELLLNFPENLTFMLEIEAGTVIERVRTPARILSLIRLLSCPWNGSGISAATAHCLLAQ